MNCFLYLLFGRNRIYEQEVIISLLSLQYVSSSDKYEVIIYTDHVIELPKNLHLEVTFRLLTQQELSEWLQLSGFLLSLKPAIIKDFFKNHDGNVIFVDTDTFFTQDPRHLFDEIEKGNFVMHLKENLIKQRKTLKKYISHRKFKAHSEKVYVIDREVEMWNSGVVGLSKNCSNVLDDIIKLIDQMCFERKWHTNEQLAFSYFFQQKGNIISADEYVFHYWFFRPIRVILTEYFHQTHYGADAEFIKKIIEHGIVDQNMDFEDLPIFSMDIFVAYGQLFDWHLANLPGQSFIGSLLRDRFSVDFRSKFFIFKSDLIHRLGLSHIDEVEKQTFNYG